MPRHAFVGASVFDGACIREQAALIVEDALVQAISADALPKGCSVTRLNGGVIAPGYVDLQVNGGGGILFNDDPCVDGLARIAAAHAALGATAILPTLITDTPAQTARAIAAARAAIAKGVPGILGLHLEGPHLALSRKGAHDPALIRPMTAEDLAQLCAAARALPVLMVTLAPEVVRPDQIEALVAAGAVVSLGHSDADLATCRAAVRAGARCVTHLFNAMSPLGSREPGLVGAALSEGAVSAGLIADGIHVHPTSIALALRAKAGPGRVFLVSDAMALAGSKLEQFTLNGRLVTRQGGRLTLADGTLAGADLDLSRAVRVMVGEVGIPLEQALAMATSVPAAVIGQGDRWGRLAPGGPADFIHLDSDLHLTGVWRGGQRLPTP
jgi:N-acetylglucosamine-6-phosphate deacetylase